MPAISRHSADAPDLSEMIIAASKNGHIDARQLRPGIETLPLPVPTTSTSLELPDSDAIPLAAQEPVSLEPQPLPVPVSTTHLEQPARIQLQYIAFDNIELKLDNFRHPD